MKLIRIIKKINNTPKNNFIYKFLRYTPVLKWFFSYPEVFLRFPSKRLNFKVNKLRLQLWTKLASNSAEISYLYKKDNKNQINYLDFNNKNNIKDSLHALDLSEMVEKAKIYGCSYMNNFLDEDEHKLLLEEFSEKNLKSKSQNQFLGKGVLCINKRLSEENLKIFQKKINYLTKNLLGKAIYIKKINLQKLNKVSQDIEDPNTILHIDRFLPAIKFFYYPEKVSLEQGPFGFIPFSHIINKPYLSSVEKSFCENKDSPFSINNPTDFNEIALTVEANTFLIAFTNGLHRRIPFQIGKNLRRHSCRFIFYDSFTRSDLISNFISNIYK